MRLVRGNAVLCLATAMTALACSGSSGGSAVDRGAAPPVRPSPSAQRFLARYVTSDGRVLRRDQGGDVVSEGQAYGMLIAELADRPDTARTIWSWTAAHLQRSDGLLRFHANGAGQVESTESATDADVLAAYALLRYRGSNQNALHAAGSRIARAVLAGESVTDPHGAPVLVAGPWARLTKPPTVNPSYWMPSVFTALARYTGDQRWKRAADTAISLLAQATDEGRALPTDWAQLNAGRLVPVPNPGGGAPVQYGLDAARLPLWLGTACASPARRLAAAWWTNVLRVDHRSADLALTPSGTIVNPSTNPLPLLAGAAAAAAAGDDAASRSLVTEAGRQAKAVPTYYGDAWLVLGQALLDGSLDPCHE